MKDTWINPRPVMLESLFGGFAEHLFPATSGLYFQEPPTFFFNEFTTQSGLTVLLNRIGTIGPSVNCVPVLSGLGY